ncbi:beta-N-acetylhexosaminidase [Marinilabilia rubra]|uniref:beta-N-acetylhexosaminidase n=1 Tax=Marinilabilia rubra TaxID=2162893 RepID=A0A2U2B899_9BACT|nr:beta-N-acetylhexosaminidase [Marinilabilia rubra]PWD99311.1 beta-N-acetylhexosaminidase [Marinilabilia rubra]
MKMRISILTTLLLGGFFLILTSCRESYPPTDMHRNSVIPKPVSVVASNGTFVLDEGTSIYVQTGNEGLKKSAVYLAEMLRNATGFELEIEETDDKPWRGNIFLTSNVSETENSSKEYYELNITEKLVTIASTGAEGSFYGIQTLRQLLPAGIETAGALEEPLLLPTGTIKDWPQYEYRGAMLDVARHFFDVETVKRFIDYLALYKMNFLHLHLTDDQGWRIEIESWPNLTKHGGSTEVGGGEGGYFTKADYKEIIQYAADKHITIVPEVDMPGHTNAALASYPELNCDGKATDLYTGMKVGFSTLCTDKEVVYEFVDDVVREISEMTPGPYFHIGGDESHSTEQDDYVYFINRAMDIVKSYGKTMIGWDEVAHAEINSEDVVQYWSKEENASLGVEKGAKVLISPAKHAYLDMKYDSTTVLGLTWAGVTEVDKAYNWSPEKLVDGITKENILGVEAPLWSETVETLDDIEFLIFPRLAGHAEVGWTASKDRSWDEYKERLGRHQNRFKALGIDFYQSPLVPWQDEGDFFVQEENKGTSE